MGPRANFLRSLQAVGWQLGLVPSVLDCSLTNRSDAPVLPRRVWREGVEVRPLPCPSWLHAAPARALVGGA